MNGRAEERRAIQWGAVMWFRKMCDENVNIKDVFTLTMTTAVFAETLEKLQNSVSLVPVNRNYISSVSKTVIFLS
jgi:pyridoxine 5'-phosphate synthase PdxJ